MTTQPKTLEEIVEEFERRAKHPPHNETLATDSLRDDTEYLESQYELDEDLLKDFLTQALKSYARHIVQEAKGEKQELWN